MNAAAVYDIRSDVPKPTDRFFVDTNVWKYVAYSKASTTPGSSTGADYGAYLQRCLKTQAQLHWSALSFSELAHLIEDIEYDIYNASVAPQFKCSKKQFRQGTSERQQVVNEVDGVWQLVEQMGVALPTSVADPALAAAIALFRNHPLDGYDIFYVNAMNDSGVRSIVTDDIDFIYVPGLSVFTANAKALFQASTFKKLHVR